MRAEEIRGLTGDIGKCYVILGDWIIRVTFRPLQGHLTSGPLWQHCWTMFLRCFCLLFILSLPLGAQSADPEQAVVKIMNFSQRPDWVEPWRFSRVNRSSGSGFVIAGQRIMTNAHVVSWSKQILVHRYQDPKPYLATIEYIGHDCDLAVLSVEDEAFFEGIEPLDIGVLP